MKKNDVQAVKRSLLRYPGGKWRIAPWIISHFPEHRIYVEPFCGAASVFLRKSRSKSEVLNDTENEIVNLFRVLRDPADSDRLRFLLKTTPFAREELALAREKSDEPVEAARRLIVRSFFGRSSCLVFERTGFRASRRSNTFPSNDWVTYNEALVGIIDRVQGVTIENLPALEILKRFDTEETLFYVDPPYPLHTRSPQRKKMYGKNEMSDEDHMDLARFLNQLEGFVVLSGYRCSLYDDLFASWTRHEKKTRADGGGARVECLWLNDKAESALRRITVWCEG